MESKEESKLDESSKESGGVSAKQVVALAASGQESKESHHETKSEAKCGAEQDESLTAKDILQTKKISADKSVDDAMIRRAVGSVYADLQEKLGDFFDRMLPNFEGESEEHKLEYMTAYKEYEILVEQHLEVRAAFSLGLLRLPWTQFDFASFEGVCQNGGFRRWRAVLQSPARCIGRQSKDSQNGKTACSCDRIQQVRQDDAADGKEESGGGARLLNSTTPQRKQ
jgi:hypothetical protein